MSKLIFSALNGAVTLTEDAGVFTLALADSASIGGGVAAGIAKVGGDAHLVLDGATGLKLGEALLNSHLPAAALPLATVVETVVNTAVAALE